ncbi:MAG TPA: aldo/keto reductase [Terracidiphilus sp.]|nr:aldo/keto reductase [Terracidiphilus sp.]HUX28510.1 aldo/keto reductase [Terracidiphilus sp.]
MDRRDFLKTATVAAGVAATEQLLAPALRAAETTPAGDSAKGAGMIYRTLGRTGERVSAIGLGGYHIGHPGLQEQESIQLIRQSIDRGITFMDNCWDYNGGVSEVRMGKALLDGYRGKVFLMTKIDGRTKAEAARQIDQSLERLQTDHVDLMQFHEVIRLEDPDRIFAEGGAMEAMLEAKKAGKVRYIGFTGHKDPLVHLRMLDEARAHAFHFDAVQMPLNVMDAHFRSFEHHVLPVLVREGIAPLGMKAFGDHFILESKTVTPIEGLHYCLNLPISVQITGIDSQAVLDQALEAARTFKPMSEAEVASLLERTKDAAQAGKYELFKTTSMFDGTAHNPKWLG